MSRHSVGWLLLAGGVVQIVHVVRLRTAGHFAWHLGLGVLYVLVGLTLFIHPLQGLVTLTMLVAALFIIDGVLKVLFALRLRPAGNWGWLLVSGLVALLLGVVIVANLPGSAGWRIGVLLGVNMLISGLSLVLLSSAARQASVEGGTGSRVVAEQPKRDTTES